jgi:hypothetical protein
MKLYTKDHAYICGYCQSNHIDIQTCIVTFNNAKIKRKFIMKLRECMGKYVKYTEEEYILICMGLKILLDDDITIIPQWIYEDNIYKRFYCFGILDGNVDHNNYLYFSNDTTYEFVNNLAELLREFTNYTYCRASKCGQFISV